MATQIKPAIGDATLEQKRRGVGYFRQRTILTTLVVAILAIVFIWPFLCIVGWSLNRLDVQMNPLWPIPEQFSLNVYRLMFTEYGFQRYIWNSVLVVTASTVLGTFASALAGYALAKLVFPGRKVLFLLILGVMLLPTETMLVPKFIVLRSFGMVNNYWGLILPAVGGGAFGIFLMRQFMLQVPTEMMEAGRIDGCNEFGLFTRVVLPTMKAPVAVLATLALRANWNSLLWPQILITDDTKQLLMPAIARLNMMTVADPFARPVVISAAILAALVPLTVYAYSQRHFVASLTGAVKG